METIKDKSAQQQDHQQRPQQNTGNMQMKNERRFSCTWKMYYTECHL